MNSHFQRIILETTGANELVKTSEIQRLWSGYGEIARYRLRGKGTSIDQVVIKHVKLPTKANHPRGWNTDLSHQRKVKSYQVESAWYEKWSYECNEDCKVPACYLLKSENDEFIMVLEDLDETGFPIRNNDVTLDELNACLVWLANFHATFMHKEPQGLWETGTYWHLETRPDELEDLKDIDLKNAAAKIDQKLKDSPFQTFVHGDAKLANFCFSEDGKTVAAVDFQYVGGGCGIKDVAYFIGSCLDEKECEKQEESLLKIYFNALKVALENKEIDFDALEENWRELYPVAWTDFHRFLKGWSPGHWKMNGYSERLTREVLSKI